MKIGLGSVAAAVAGLLLVANVASAQQGPPSKVPVKKAAQHVIAPATKVAQRIAVPGKNKAALPVIVPARNKVATPVVVSARNCRSGGGCAASGERRLGAAGSTLGETGQCAAACQRSATCQCSRDRRAEWAGGVRRRLRRTRARLGASPEAVTVNR